MKRPISWHRPDSRLNARSWAVSLLIHGLFVAGAALLLSDLRLAPQPEPFRWEVAMVDSSAPTALKSPPGSQPHADVPATIPPSANSPVENSMGKETAPISSLRERTEVQKLPPIQTGEPIERNLQQPVSPPQEVGRFTTAEPVPTGAIQPSTQPDAQPMVEDLPVRESTDTALHGRAHEPSTESRSASHPLPSETHTSTAMAQVEVEEVRGQPAPPGRMGREAQGDSPLDDPTGPQVARIPPIESATAPQPSENASAQEAPAAKAPAAQPDYSWLAQALWSRVHALKRYPLEARLNRLEGQVVLRIVIQEDGRLLDLEVVKSSGHAVLDHNALEVVKSASPLTLTHPLGRSQVVVQVPISYRLDQK